jgi:hypothetical protein
MVRIAYGAIVGARARRPRPRLRSGSRRQASGRHSVSDRRSAERSSTGRTAKLRLVEAVPPCVAPSPRHPPRGARHARREVPASRSASGRDLHTLLPLSLSSITVAGPDPVAAAAIPSTAPPATAAPRRSRPRTASSLHRATQPEETAQSTGAPAGATPGHIDRSTPRTAATRPVSQQLGCLPSEPINGLRGA